nr:MAG TPA: hypothetical protein [Bacteriophage sp.]
MLQSKPQYPESTVLRFKNLAHGKTRSNTLVLFLSIAL